MWIVPLLPLWLHNVAGAALRNSPLQEHIKSCNDQELSALRARIAELETQNKRITGLELENKALRARVIALSGTQDPKVDLYAAAHQNQTSSFAAANSSHGLQYFPAPDMPSPMPGQTYVPELNMPATDAPFRHVTVPGSNEFGQPMAYSTLTLAAGKTLTYDDIAYGYNLLWADLALWKMQRWKGMRFFQAPTDMLAIQQLVWKEQPDMLIEIGTHGGGSAVFLAELMRAYNPAAIVVTMDPDNSNIDPNGLFYKTPEIKFLNGPSGDPKIFQQVQAFAQGKKKIMVIQDGLHSFEGVSSDLALYEPLVTVGSYFVVQDTTLDRAYGGAFNGAMKAIQTYCAAGSKGYGRLVPDKAYEYLLFSTNHNGYLKKINV
eukprot:gnl/MRDRNA2_/MRDRNA2_29816_c0_seq1.p1 gnl/MRDRNA2_/MRDRNA2_29816_c0~~gnl/MRDRNA2_/MRDRNA2_29816_c0_seq1.p1  ORF type:complete len:376 (-),score=74.76 gnl/MRDRNA2_/MRDRNA2_29816_c0_seq1:40-1167(-)